MTTASLFHLALIAITILILLTGISASPAQGSRVSHRDDVVKESDSGIPKGYSLAVMHMIGTVGNTPIDHKGTVQEIFAQLAAEHKDFAMPTAQAASQIEARSKLESRSKYGLGCIAVKGQSWDKARKHYIEDGINYLNHVKAWCHAPANSCVRVSCSWRAAIYLCNDNNHEIDTACNYISTFAQDMVDKCTSYNWRRVFTSGGYTRWVTGGQEFDTDRFNVVVRDDKTC
ncbi:hypothetical protein DL98DRAFT_626085 [Cadophora sp. DSE1049]|nr:hypothetical protein DL98DRAFT_626085 [Cadophora sp. DSE1049]